jgi:hypothetical protein
MTKEYWFSFFALFELQADYIYRLNINQVVNMYLIYFLD